MAFEGFENSPGPPTGGRGGIGVLKGVVTLVRVVDVVRVRCGECCVWESDDVIVYMCRWRGIYFRLYLFLTLYTLDLLFLTLYTLNLLFLTLYVLDLLRTTVLTSLGLAGPGDSGNRKLSAGIS